MVVLGPFECSYFSQTGPALRPQQARAHSAEISKTLLPLDTFRSPRMASWAAALAVLLSAACTRIADGGSGVDTRTSSPSLAPPPRPAFDWEATYGFWRQADSPRVPLSTWLARTPSPVPRAYSPAEWEDMDDTNRTATFHECLVSQAVAFGIRGLRYRSPVLQEVRQTVSSQVHFFRALVTKRTSGPSPLPQGRERPWPK